MAEVSHRSVSTRLAAAGLLVASFATVSLSGCVGPMACGPMGCDAGGPLVINDCDGCGSCDGCGELYIDPWINHPADACDPCDQCGNYNGQSCGKCRSVFSGLPSLWGYRCGAACETGCDGCQVPCGSGGLHDIGCGCGAEPACGIEPACGVEGCGGCDSCGGGASYLSGQPTLADGAYIVEGHEAVHPVQPPRHFAKPYRPQRTRQIFRSRGESVTQIPRSTDY